MQLTTIPHYNSVGWKLAVTFVCVLVSVDGAPATAGGHLDSQRPAGRQVLGQTECAAPLNPVEALRPSAQHTDTYYILIPQCKGYTHY